MRVGLGQRIGECTSPPSPARRSARRSSGSSSPGRGGCAWRSTGPAHPARWLAAGSPRRCAPRAGRRSWSTPATSCGPPRCGWSSAAPTPTSSSTAGWTRPPCAGRCSTPRPPAAPGRVLPRLWDARADRAYRDRYTALPDDGVLLLHGALLLGRGLPVDARRAPADGPGRAGRGHLPEDCNGRSGPRPARRRARPAAEADLLVLADHPDRPAVQRNGDRCDGKELLRG